MNLDVDTPLRRTRIKLGFGSAGIAVGALTTGLTSLLLVYYCQVLGLSPSLAGFALALALIIDAISDPLVGVWSDRTRTFLGRRHPYLYASIAPMAFFYWLLWFPPFDSANQWGLFIHLAVTTVLLRLSITLFDVPANALIPELTQNYDLRTSYSAAKTSLSWMSANAIGIAMYAFWLGDHGGPPGSGVLRKSGYEDAAIVVASLVALSALAMTLLIRVKDIPKIPKAPQNSDSTGMQTPGIWNDLMQVYKRRSVLSLLGSAMLFSAGSGTALALWIYIYAYFWGLGSKEIIAVQVMYLLSALVSLIVLPRISATRDKRNLALMVSGLFWLCDVTPITLRLMGLLPPNGSDALTVILCGHALLNGVLFNMVVTLVLSMLSDVVEEHEVDTGARQEAALLAGQTLVSKTSAALGTFFGGALLGWIAFPSGVAPGDVAQETLRFLGLVYVPVMLCMGGVSTFFLTRYRMSRLSRQDLLSKLGR